LLRTRRRKCVTIFSRRLFGRIATAAACSIVKDFADTVTLLGFRIVGDHVKHIMGYGHRLVAELAAAIFQAGPDLCLGWLLWGWTLYVRSNLEYASAVWRKLTKPEECRLEKLQTRALLAFVRRGARQGTRYSAPVLRELFGFETLADRRRLGRLKFLLKINALSGRRVAMSEQRRARSADDTAQIAALPRVLNRFQTFVRRGERHKRQRRHTAARTFAATSRLAILLHEWDALLAMPGIPDSLARAAAADDADLADLAVDSDDDDEAGERLDESRTDEPASGSARDFWDRSVARRFAFIRVRLLQDSRRRRHDELSHCTSSAMVLAFSPTSQWRRQVLTALPAGSATAAYLAFLAGCFWPCPLTRDDERGHFTITRTCACGAQCDAVDLHFLFGKLALERDCFVARPVVFAWRRAIRAVFVKHQCASVLGVVGLLSLRLRAALFLGSPRLFPDVVSSHFPRLTPQARPRTLSLDMQRDLARAFIDTIGVWSAQQRASFHS